VFFEKGKVVCVKQVAVAVAVGAAKVGYGFAVFVYHLGGLAFIGFIVC